MAFSRPEHIAMETLHTISLLLHVASGSIALLAGTAILLLRKGNTAHRRFGRVFFVALIMVSLSAFALSIIRPNPFLFMVGVFTLYQGLGGYRAVIHRSLQPAWRDWAVTAMGAANALAMLWTGQLVLLVFGGISAYMVVGDLRTYVLVRKKKPVPKLLWLQRHIGHLMGAYIATVTAFLVTNATASTLGAVVWFAPTVVGVPLLVYWSRRYAPATSPTGQFGALRMP